MKIDDLPEALFSEAVALWHEAGLTRPWNDPDADLARAMRAENATVLAARDEGGALLGTAMVGHDGHRGWVYYLAVSFGQPQAGGQPEPNRCTYRRCHGVSTACRS
jgi:hypothetical protein